MIKQLASALIFIICTVTISTAQNDQPAVIFSQEVIAVDKDGNLLPSLKIEPQAMDNLKAYDFELGRSRLLRIQTNISKAEERGLQDVVETVKSCYQHIETMSGRPLKQGVMLYLIELDEIPYAYNFRATYQETSKWGEVRLALIERDSTLNGSYMPATLSELLYDTLPHELAHDVLDDIPQLLHDINGAKSNLTRWFIEGICEVLAKEFSRQEVPALHQSFIALRNPDSVLTKASMLKEMMGWEQNNNNGMALESDLYGAAMLTMMAWLEYLPMSELLAELEAHQSAIQGEELVSIMQRTTDVGMEKIIERAHYIGTHLKDNVVLAQLTDKHAKQ